MDKCTDGGTCGLGGYCKDCTLIEQEAIEYQPKGSMCVTCSHVDSDCSGLDFQSMRVIEKTEYLRVVKCSEHERAR